MRTRLKFLIFVLAAFFSLGFGQSVVVTGKKITYTRPKPLSDYKKTFTVNYPKVKASTLTLSRKIENSISYERVCQLNIRDEMRDTQWLWEADYEIKYNKNGILTVELIVNGSGAYPSGYTRNANVDIRTGNRVKPANVFVNLRDLAAMVRNAQRMEIKNSIEEIKKEPDYQEPNPESLFTNANFTTTDLGEFSIGDKGVTFPYDYGFPHVILALQPDGQFFFTWAQLKPYIKRGGLLARFIR